MKDLHLVDSQPDFTRPIELMMDCHRRVEHFLNVLVAVAQRAHGGALDEANRRALETALHYFHAAAPRHTEDEEQSLFPRLRRNGDPRAAAVMASVDSLEAEHIEARAAHQRIDQLAERWLNDDYLPPADADDLLELLLDLRAAYEQHIFVEDSEVFPVAADVLSAAELAAIGREMADRRAANPGRPQSRCAQRRIRLAVAAQERGDGSA